MNDDLGRGKLGAIGSDPRPLLSVLRVEKAGVQPGVGLDQDFKASFLEVSRETGYPL